MSIGMSYEQFWHGDVNAFPHYREMHRMQTDRINEQMWLQGLYIYDALCCASPVFRDFTKKGTKPAPYPQAPYPISHKAKEHNEEIEQKKQYEKNKARMAAIMASVNRRFEQPTAKGSETDERNS